MLGLEKIRNGKHIMFIIIAVSLSLIIGTVALAENHSGWFWSQGPDSLTYTFDEEEIGLDSRDAFIMGVYYWETATNSPVDLDYTEGSADIEIYEVYNEVNPYSGKWWHVPVHPPGELDSAECAMNTYVTGGYTDEKRISVAGHELGHVFGLSHEDWELMDGSDYWRYDVSGIYQPTYSDIVSINALYD